MGRAAWAGTPRCGVLPIAAPCNAVRHPAPCRQRAECSASGQKQRLMPCLCPAHAWAWKCAAIAWSSCTRRTTRLCLGGGGGREGIGCLEDDGARQAEAWRDLGWLQRGPHRTARHAGAIFDVRGAARVAGRRRLGAACRTCSGSQEVPARLTAACTGPSSGWPAQIARERPVHALWWQLPEGHDLAGMGGPTMPLRPAWR